jgi:4-alpha-glucanotransferase
VLASLGTDGAGAVERLVERAYASVARLAVVPLQDVLGLGSEARMNHPGRPGGNWTWRASPAALSADVAQRMASLARRTHRGAS